MDDLTALVEDIRHRAMVAGQCSVEGPEDTIALMALAEAQYLTRLADRLAALLAQRAPAPDVQAFVERCRDIREGSPNAFYAHVDRFCALFPDPDKGDVMEAQPAPSPRPLFGWESCGAGRVTYFTAVAGQRVKHHVAFSTAADAAKAVDLIRHLASLFPEPSTEEPTP